VGGQREGRQERRRTDRAAYLQLDKPSIAEPVRHYAGVTPDLFNAVVDLCVQPGKICRARWPCSTPRAA
jgi:hypothetical protein